MFKTLANAWKHKDLRNKLLFVCAILLVYRIGTAIPVPFVDANVLSDSFTGTIFGFLNTLSGGALEQGSLFALGVSPYITASIVIQLLTVAIPPLERLAKQGEEGKRKINAITRYITIALSIITALGYYFLLKQYNALSSFATDAHPVLSAFVILACYCAGSSIVMWLAEKINDHGIGNGISLILFANIVSRAGPLLMNFISMFRDEYSGVYYNIGGFQLQIQKGAGHVIGSTIFTVLAIVGMLALIWYIIYISDSERRIPINYAKRNIGRKMYGGQSTNIPLKINMAGVMPIIFANAILQIPSTITMFTGTPTSGFWKVVYDLFSPTSGFYAVLTFVLILAFAYFYVSISFNPTEVAQNIQRNGGAVPGLRPGKPTSDYIKKVLSNVTFMGALSLSVVAVIPLFIHVIINLVPTICGWFGGTAPVWFSTYSYASELAFSGTSVIIVVGVILETVREIEAELAMRTNRKALTR